MQRIDRKGLIHFKSADGTAFKWKAYRIHLNNTDIINWHLKDDKITFPKLLIGNFILTRTGDTYFDLTPFFKGYVWVNGQLLGRYWNVGPQHSLFCPGVWLKKEENTIQVLEFGKIVPASIGTRADLS